MISLRRAVFILGLFLSLPSIADWDLSRVSGEAALYSTNNVYQDDLNKKSDVYTQLSSGFQFAENSDTLNASLAAVLYSKESSNNYITFQLRYKNVDAFKDMDLNLSLGGLRYSQNENGSTDERYNNYYLRGYLTKSIFKRSNFEGFFEPGLKFYAYPELSNRRDLVIFFRLDSAWEITKIDNLSSYVEMGFLRSNQSYYSRNYLDFNFSYSRNLSQDDLLFVDLFFRSSTYPNRTVTDILLTPRGNGRVTSTSIEVNETSQLSDLTIGLSRFVDDLTFTGSYTISQLTTLSQLEYYNEHLIKLSIERKF